MLSHAYFGKRFFYLTSNAVLSVFWKVAFIPSAIQCCCKRMLDFIISVIHGCHKRIFESGIFCLSFKAVTSVFWKVALFCLPFKAVTSAFWTSFYLPFRAVTNVFWKVSFTVTVVLFLLDMK